MNDDVKPIALSEVGHRHGDLAGGGGVAGKDPDTVGFRCREGIALFIRHLQGKTRQIDGIAHDIVRGVGQGLDDCGDGVGFREILNAPVGGEHFVEVPVVPVGVPAAGLGSCAAVDGHGGIAFGKDAFKARVADGTLNHIGAIGKTCDTAGDIDHPQSIAAAEGIFADGLQTVGEDQLRQTVAVAEGKVADVGHGGGQIQLLQILAAVERFVIDGGKAAGEGDGRKAAAAEHVGSDGGKAVGNHQVSDQLAVQIQVMTPLQGVGPVVAEVDAAPLGQIGNVHGGEAAAAGKGITVNLGHRLRNVDAGQAGTAGEGAVFQGRQSLGQSGLRHGAAAGEGIAADGGDGGGNGSLRHARQLVEGVFADGGGAFFHNDLGDLGCSAVPGGSRVSGIAEHAAGTGDGQHAIFNGPGQIAAAVVALGDIGFPGEGAAVALAVGGGPGGIALAVAGCGLDAVEGGGSDAGCVTQEVDACQTGTVIEGVAVYFRNTCRQIDACQCGKAECSDTDGGNTLLQGHRSKRRTLTEDARVEVGHGAGNGHLGQTGAALEGIPFDFRHGIRNGQIRQAGTAVEGLAADGGQRAGEGHAEQIGAVFEGAVRDGGNTLGNHHMGLPDGIAVQELVGHPVAAIIGGQIRVGRYQSPLRRPGGGGSAYFAVKLGAAAVSEGATVEGCNAGGDKNTLEVAAMSKSLISDGRHGIGQSNGGKPRAVTECAGTDGGNIAADGCLRQTGAFVERIFAEGFDTAAAYDLLQAGTAVEGILADGYNAGGDGDALQIGAVIEGIIRDAGNPGGDLHMLAEGIRADPEGNLFLIDTPDRVAAAVAPGACPAAGLGRGTAVDGQTGIAVVEGIVFNGGHAGGNENGLKAGTAREGIAADGLQTAGHAHLGQCGTAVEGLAGDGRNVFGNGYALQIGVSVEGIGRNGGDIRRNRHHFAEGILGPESTLFRRNTILYRKGGAAVIIPVAAPTCGCGSFLAIQNRAGAAAIEGRIAVRGYADGGDAGGNVDRQELLAAFKGQGLDLGHRIGNGIAAGHAGGDLDQGGHGLVVQCALVIAGVVGIVLRHPDGCQIVAAGEGVAADGGNAGGHSDLRQCVAVIEGLGADGGKAIGQGDFRQSGTALEGILLDVGDTGGNGDFLQRRAAVEGILADARDAAAHMHSRQTAAAVEGIGSDGGDTVGNGHFQKLPAVLKDIVLDFGHRVGNGILAADSGGGHHERCHGLVVKDAAGAGVGGVSGIDPDFLQHGAAAEDLGPDVSNAGGNGHGSQTAAGAEGILTDGGDAVGDLNAVHCVAALEGILADGCGAAVEGHGLQTAAALEGIISDGLYGGGNGDIGGLIAAVEGILTDGRDAAFHHNAGDGGPAGIPGG